MPLLARHFDTSIKKQYPMLIEPESGEQQLNYETDNASLKSSPDPRQVDVEMKEDSLEQKPDEEMYEAAIDL